MKKAEKAVDKKLKDSEGSSTAEALQELTVAVTELTRTVRGMKETHDKWVRAGKF